MDKEIDDELNDDFYDETENLDNSESESVEVEDDSIIIEDDDDLEEKNTSLN